MLYLRVLFDVVVTFGWRFVGHFVFPRVTFLFCLCVVAFRGPWGRRARATLAWLFGPCCSADLPRDQGWVSRSSLSLYLVSLCVLRPSLVCGSVGCVSLAQPVIVKSIGCAGLGRGVCRFGPFVIECTLF